MQESTDLQAVQAMVDEIGFDGCGSFDASKLVARPEVRDMCAADRCNAYNTNWSCPPACGTVEEFQEYYSKYSQGLLFQTVIQMEDDFDFESVMEGAELHKQRFSDLIDKVNESGRNIALLGAGGCNLCSTCSYPDEPCRQPERMKPSMEASGLVVNEVCGAANVPYNHGPCTLAYSSCALVN